jgi:F-type H+-transporting ATPase subunit alpha
MLELMKQKQYAPMSIAEMSVSLYAAERGFLQDVEVAKIISFEQALIAFFKRDHADLMAKINEKGDFNDEIDAGLKAGIEKFKATQTW